VPKASRFLVVLVALAAVASAALGAVLGAQESDEADRAAVPERAGRPLERKVAQLFLAACGGTDAGAEIYSRLKRLDLGGIVLARENFLDLTQLGALAGEARKVAVERGHLVPWVMTAQDGAEFNGLPGLPPATAPADLDSADAAGAEAAVGRGAGARPRGEARLRADLTRLTFAGYSGQVQTRDGRPLLPVVKALRPRRGCR
jgi:hypothetical protein